MLSGEQQVKAIIKYDSKRSNGATTQIAQAIAQTIRRHGIRAEAVHPSLAKLAYHKLVVIGLPIYEERPMKSVISYVDKNRDNYSTRQ